MFERQPKIDPETKITLTVKLTDSMDLDSPYKKICYECPVIQIKKFTGQIIIDLTAYNTIINGLDPTISNSFIPIYQYIKNTDHYSESVKLQITDIWHIISGYDPYLQPIADIKNFYKQIKESDNPAVFLIKNISPTGRSNLVYRTI
jgi:hypothetical protein